MTVADADGDDAAEHVQVAAAGVVKQPLHVALVDDHRTAVIRQQGRAQVVQPDLADGGRVRTLWRDIVWILPSAAYISPVVCLYS